MTKRTALAAGALLLTGTLSACAAFDSPPFPLPDEPGLYALSEDDELQRLDGEREWEAETWPERADLGPYTRFVVFDPLFARDARAREELVDLWRVAWVRSEVDPSGLAGPVEGSEWAVAPMEQFNVPLTFEHAPGEPDYVLVTPRRPLDPGLYSLRLNRVGESRVARLGVGWPAVDRRGYSAANCVDRHIGDVPRYQPCSGAGGLGAATPRGLDAGAGQGLEITLVDPLRREDSLIVQGVVINTANTPRRVPPMQAILIDGEGRRLTETLIDSQQVDLRSGERMRFKTEIANAPPSTARIDVVFIPAAGM